MRVTIIPADNMCIIDGQLRVFQFNVDANYHAIQWYGNYGSIETKSGDNIRIASLGQFDSIVSEHASILAQEEAARTAYQNSQQRYVDYLSAYRYERENGGLTINGVTIPTDIATRTNLLGAKELNTSIQWKTVNGFVALTAQQVSDIATAVGVHVQKCFSAEATVQANIGNYTTEQQIRDAFDAAYSA